MNSNKDKTVKPKSKKGRKKTTKKKAKSDLPDDTGIILIDDDLEVDTEKELEERRAYLEEARSQEASEN